MTRRVVHIGSSIKGTVMIAYTGAREARDYTAPCTYTQAALRLQRAPTRRRVPTLRLHLGCSARLHGGVYLHSGCTQAAVRDYTAACTSTQAAARACAHTGVAAAP
jgi:hypothetical protein